MSKQRSQMKPELPDTPVSTVRNPNTGTSEKVTLDASATKCNAPKSGSTDSTVTVANNALPGSCRLFLYWQLDERVRYAHDEFGQRIPVYYGGNVADYKTFYLSNTTGKQVNPETTPHNEYKPYGATCYNDARKQWRILRHKGLDGDGENGDKSDLNTHRAEQQGVKDAMREERATEMLDALKDVRRELVKQNALDRIAKQRAAKIERDLSARSSIEANATKKLELTAEEEAKRKNFAYEASAEFVSEALHNADAQRHNRDNVSLHSTFEQRMTQWQRSISEREQERLKQQEIENARLRQAALVAEKLAQGLAEVVVDCVVTLYDIDADETVSYYILSDHKEYRHKQRVYVENYDTPPGGADERLRADTELGKAIIGRFVGDELDAPVPNGVYKCRIVAVVACVTNANPVGRGELSVKNRPVQEAQAHARIGSEAWTFFARENGSFGSISVHDDYSDEANAEIYGSELYEAEGLDEYE